MFKYDENTFQSGDFGEIDIFVYKLGWIKKVIGKFFWLNINVEIIIV